MERVASGPSVRQVIKKLPHVLKSFRKESNALVREYQSRGHLSEQKRKRYEDLNRRTQLIESVQSLLHSKDKSSLTSVFGPKLQYLPLLLVCFHSAPFGKRDVAMSRRRTADEGGSATFFNKQYSIEFCPFVYLTQISNQTDTWRKRNDL